MSKKEEPLWNSNEHHEAMERQVRHGCLFLAIFFLLIYVVFVMFFWMIGGIAHKSTRSNDNLRQAQTAEEVAAELAARFGRFNFGRAAQDAKEAAAQKVDDIKEQAIDSATQAAAEAATNATNQAINQTTNEVVDQIDLNR